MSAAPVTGSSGQWRRDARIALCGALAAMAIAAGLAASLGLYGRTVANQTLLSNLGVHLGAASGLLCLFLAGLGWRLIGATGVVCAVAVVAVTLMRVPWTPVGRAEAVAARLEIMHFNVLAWNTRRGALAAALRDSGADVLVLLESEGVAPRLGELSDIYPHRFGCDGALCEIMILSKLPLEHAEWLAFPGVEQRLATAVVRPGGRAVRLVAAHFTKDFFTGVRGSQGWALTGAIRKLRLRDPMPVLVTGDFNAAPWDPVFRTIALHADLRLPWAWLPTWPARAGPLGIPIDHILVSETLGVERIAPTPDGIGSNHRGLRATIAIAP